jgi:hypothetical protein
MATQAQPSLRDRWAKTERAMRPEVHGFLNAFTELPGVRLRKLGDIPDVTDPKTGQVVKPGQQGDLVWDFYSPFSEQPRPDEYSTLDEKLTYQGGEGRGGLANAALLIPNIIRSGTRFALEALAGKKVRRAASKLAGEQKALGDAAEWMSPRTIPEGAPSVGPAMLGNEAAAAANAAPGRIRAAEDELLAAGQALRRAPNVGADSAVDVMRNAVLVGKPMAAGLSTILNESAGSVDRENRPNIDPDALAVGDSPVIPEPQKGPNTDMQQPRTSPAERFRQAMAGNEGLPRYQAPRKNLVQRASDYLNPRQAHERDLRNEEQFYKNEAMQRYSMDPETRFMLEQLGYDLATEREIGAKKELKTPAQEFGLRYGPAMQTSELESLYGLPAGSISEDALRRMGAEKRLDPMDLLMMQLLNNMGQFGPAASGKFNNQPTLNVPPTR